MATEERLKPFKPLLKFLCVKTIIFFSYWQSCFFNALQLLGIFDHKKSTEIFNLVICGEIVVAAIA